MPGHDNAFRSARAAFEMARDDLRENVESDAEFSLFDTAFNDARRVLLTTPSPDVAALAYKLQVFQDEEIYHARADQIRAVLQVMITDACRLNNNGNRKGDSKD